jgi:uncharacterized protein YjbI with pentapeptide repeats
VALAFLAATAGSSRADVFRWDNGQLIPGTEGITPGPGVQLDHHELAYADLNYQNLTGSRFDFSNLSYASLRQSTLTNANLSGAVVNWANFNNAIGFTKEQLYSTASYQAKNLTGIGLTISDLSGWDFSGQVVTGAALNSHSFTKEQLYSTASYQAKNLTGIVLGYIDLSGWDFHGQNLANAALYDSTLTNADLSGAVVTGARFWNTTSRGFTKEQLYSTASYQAKNLAGIGLAGNDLSGWDFHGQNLANARLNNSTFTNANLSGAVVTGASFSGTTSQGFTQEQLYLTASYQAKNLAGIELASNDLSGWDFSEQNLANARLNNSTLTNANLSGADTRGAVFSGGALAGANTNNLIQSNGHIAGLDLTAGASLVVRDYDGNPAANPPVGPLPIVVEQHLVTDATGTLRLEFDADPWDSTISFQAGIPVTLGGTLDLTFAPDVNVATQSGRTIDLFDWTGVTPTGAFTTVSSPYTWNLSNLYTTGEVTLSIPLAGDYDASGTVGPEDYNLWRANFGSTTLLAADGNGNGVVDAADYVLWRNIFQATAAMSGDYNQNGTVDAADYVVWRNGLGTTYTQSDYNVWRSHFGQSAVGAASRAALGSASTHFVGAPPPRLGGPTSGVPEPSTLILAALALVPFAWRRLGERNRVRPTRSPPCGGPNGALPAGDLRLDTLPASIQ